MPEPQRPRVSIVITSYNYAQFVAETIRSALAQEEPAEVIVVDDGSTDRSPAVIDSFGEQVHSLLRENRGNASALNAGYALSHGDAVIFLDSDDVLLPGASRAAARAIAGGAAKAHWSMPIIDAHGERTGELLDSELPEGDLRALVLREGPLSENVMPHPPTSGNAFAREVLEQMMPIPEELYRRGGGDEFLCALAVALGPIVRLEPQSLYRLHGRNEHTSWSFEQFIAFEERHHTAVFERLTALLRERGIAFDEAGWTSKAWWLRAGRVVRAIEEHVPRGERLALIDETVIGIEHELRGRGVIQFPEADGEFLGVPESDEALAGHVERLLEDRIRYVVFAWTGFWWLEDFPSLADALARDYRSVIEDSDVVIFELARA